MKPSRHLLTAILLIVASISFAQVPQGFSFQAIARDNSANPIVSTSLTVETGILSDTIANIYLWKETHAVTTNQFGLFGLTVGQGTKTGGTASTLNDINWAAAPLYIRTKVYYQSAWRDMGAARLWSVPSAMVAQKALAVTGDPVMINGGAVYILNNVGIGTNTPGTTKLAVMGDDAQSADALFEVKRKDGEVIFAVYNHGVRVNVPVDTLTKARKGGFAIGGFDKTKGFTQDYFVVSPDSIRAYFDDTPAVKGTKGGFAIGGFDVAKGTRQPYMIVNPDSVRMYIDENPAVKGTKGGFAIGGFDVAKGQGAQFLSVTGQSTKIQVKDTVQGFSVANLDTGTPTDFMKVNKVNYFIGHESGIKNTTGIYNSYLGFMTGRNNLSGSANSFYGYQAGYNNTTGSGNLFVGYQSGYSNLAGNNNSFIGYRAGFKNSTGDKNSFFGSFSGENNTGGSANMFAGIYSGRANTTGNENVFLGSQTGESNTTGSKNVFIGPACGQANTTGIQNIFIGSSAGLKNNGSDNIFIGSSSGFDNTTGGLNVFVGLATGMRNTTGAANVFLGTEAGINNIDGDNNIFIGTQSGLSNNSGNKNVFIGFQSGYKGTSSYSNVAIGHQSGYELTIAFQNTFVGESSGKNTTWGESNVFIGNAAGMGNITGSTNVHVGTGAGQKANASNNTFLGFGAGYEITTGFNNVYVGSQAGFNSKTGNNNVSLGNGAGYGNNAGSGNVFIGNYAGFSETGSNKLYIDNSTTTTPLIYGDFASDYLTINGDLNVSAANFRMISDPGTGALPAYYTYQGSAGSASKQYAFSVRDALWVTGPSWFDNPLRTSGFVDIDVLSSAAMSVAGDEALWYNGTYFSWGYGGSYNYFARKVTIGNPGSFGYMLYVSGGAYATGTWSSSDIKFKENIRTVENPLSKVLDMRGVSYNWKTSEYKDKGFAEGRHYGVIAQEIERVLPEAVATDESGEKAVAYNELVPVLIEAIKEQQKIIDDLKVRLAALEANGQK